MHRYDLVRLMITFQSKHKIPDLLQVAAIILLLNKHITRDENGSDTDGYH
jgi:hypothetical protein